MFSSGIIPDNFFRSSAGRLKFLPCVRRFPTPHHVSRKQAVIDDAPESNVAKGVLAKR